MTNNYKSLELLIKVMDERRKWLGLTKKELARRMNIEPSTIQQYFSGRHKYGPRLDQIDKIAEALEIEPWQLIKPEEAPGISVKDESLDRVLAIWRRLNKEERSRLLAAIDALLAAGLVKNITEPKAQNGDSSA